MINYRIVVKIIGLLLILEGVFMLSAAFVALIYGEDVVKAILLASAITLILGGLMSWIAWKAPKNLGSREGYIIVSAAWIVFSIFGAFPFYFSQEISSFTDCFFETMSGFTTTGASILDATEIDHFSHGLHFWRSLIQWLGGMGIIVLSLAILPFLGIGGMQLFIAEVPGPTPDKLHPRIADTAKRLWAIYVIFTIVQVLLLWIGDMTLFEATCHSFTTMATGGYSPNGNSLGAYSAYSQYIVIIFMFIAGSNFTLAYFAFHGRFKVIWRDEEFRYYLGFTLFFSLIIASALFAFNDISIERAMRESLFQVVSIMTTTGFVTADYLKWMPPFTWVILFIIMFFGGSAGSTGGGIKIVRILLLLKNSQLELKRLIHPRAIIPVRFNRHPVSTEVMNNILAFIVSYILIFVVGMLIMTVLGLNVETSMGAVITCLGNIGPGIGDVGPAANFKFIPDIGKWLLSFLMLLGRLELFTVLVLFSPAFWRR